VEGLGVGEIGLLARVILDGGLAHIPCRKKERREEGREGGREERK